MTTHGFETLLFFELILALTVAIVGIVYLHKHKAKWYNTLGYDVSILFTVAILISLCFAPGFAPLAGINFLIVCLASIPCLKKSKLAKNIPTLILFIPAIIIPIPFWFVLDFFQIKHHGKDGDFFIFAILGCWYPALVMASLIGNLWLNLVSKQPLFILWILSIIVPIILNVIFLSILGMV